MSIKKKKKKQYTFFRAPISRGIALSSDDLLPRIDRKDNIIYGVSVASIGEARGHDIELDEKFINQVIEFGNKPKLGIKSRFGHPTMSGDATGTAIGRLKNFHKESKPDDIIARADLHLGEYAFNAPKGDLATYTMNLAKEDPDQFGMSLVIKKEEERRLNADNTPMTDKEGNELLPLARIKQMYSGDVVDEPATGDGLFSELFEDTTVQFSAEMAGFLDSYLKQDGALDKVLSFLDKYSENVIYKDDKAIQEKLEIIKNNLKILEVKMLTPEQIEKKRLKDEETKKLAATAATAAATAATAAAVAPPAVSPEFAELRTKEIQAAERERVINIQKAGSAFGVPQASIDEFITKNVSLEAATVQMLAWKDSQTVTIPTQQGNVQFQVDEHEKKRTAFGEAMLVRFGLNLDDEGQVDAGMRRRVAQSEYRNMSLQNLAKACLMADGDDKAYMYDGNKLYNKIQLGMGGFAQGTGDFVNVLSNVFNKAAGKGWKSTNPTYQIWTGIGSLPNFQSNDIVRLSGLSDIEEIREGDGPKFGKMSDIKESARLLTYGTKYSLSRQAMVDDRLGMLTSIPEKQMANLSLLINRKVYELLLSNSGVGPTMNEDSKALFHADHGNLVVTGTDVGITTLNDAALAFAEMKQISPDADRSEVRYMGLEPKFLLVCPEKKYSAYNIFNSQAINIDTTFKEGSIGVNYFKSGQPGFLNLFSEPYLKLFAGGSDTPWYMFCDTALVDLITVYTLTGNETPYTAMGPNEIGYGRGLVWVLEYDFGVAAGDFRGMYRNPGA